MAKILAVDDTPYNLDLLKHSLEDEGHTVLMAANGQQGLEMVSKHQPDLVLLDIGMPVMDGREVLRKLRASEKYKDLPVIMLTAYTLDESVVQCLEGGANDYVTKPFSLKVLSARIKANLRDSDSRKQLQEDNTQLSAIAHMDALTGLLNPEAFETRFKEQFSRSRKSGNLLAMTYIAIDDLNRLFRKQGQDVGNEVLQTFAGVLAQVFRSSDVLGILEDNLFAVCMPNTRSFQVLGVLERLRKTLADTDWPVDKKYAPVTASIGVAIMTRKGTTTLELVNSAKEALRQAQARGKDQIVVSAGAELTS